MSHVKISKKLILINSASSFVAKIINMVFLIWLYQYLIKKIGPEEYSLFPVVMSVLIFFELAAVVFVDGVGRHIVEAYAKGDKEEILRLMSSVVPFIAGISIIILLVGGGVGWNVHYILNIPEGKLFDARLMLFVLIGAFVFRINFSPYQSAFSIKQAFILMNILDTARQLFSIILLASLLFGVGVWIVWVPVANAATTVLFSTISFLFAKRMVPELRCRISAFNLRSARKVLAFGFWSFLGRSANALRMAMDPIILNLFASPMAVTVFHLGASFPRQLQSLALVLFNPLQPALIAMHATEKRRQFENTFHRGNRYMLWLLLLFIVPLVVYRRELITLYVGKEYLQSATVLGFLALAQALGASYSMLWRSANAMGRIRGTTFIALSTQFLNVGVTILLVWNFRMGATGSALATLTVGLLSLIPVLALTVRLLGISFFDWLRRSLIPGIFPGVAGAMFWSALYVWQAPSTWVNLIIYGMIGAIPYLAVLLFCLNKSEKNDLKNVYGKIKDKFFGAS